MELTNRLSQFCELHDRFKQGVLTNVKIERYRQARRDVFGFLLLGQSMAIGISAIARGSLRVACTYQVEFGFPSGFVASTTHDISTSGLSAVVAEPPPEGSVIPMRLMVGDGATIVGRCQVVKAPLEPEGIRMGVAFEGMPSEAREKIETALCDVIVNSLRSMSNPQHVFLR